MDIATNKSIYISADALRKWNEDDLDEILKIRLRIDSLQLNELKTFSPFRYQKEIEEITATMFQSLAA